jgi:hypothetical protein
MARGFIILLNELWTILIFMNYLILEIRVTHNILDSIMINWLRILSHLQKILRSNRGIVCSLMRSYLIRHMNSLHNVVLDIRLIIVLLVWTDLLYFTWLILEHIAPVIHVKPSAFLLFNSDVFFKRRLLSNV